MLMAMCDGKRVCALDVTKKDKDGNEISYYCPECKEKLILRQGTKNIWHFSHRGDTSCSFNHGESAYHQFMKASIKRIFEKYNRVIKSDFEHSFGKYIADYYCEIKRSNIIDTVHKVAIECIYGNNDIDHFRAKNKFYTANNIYVIWIFDLHRFMNNKGEFKKEYRINEILKEAHTMCYGHVYGLDAYTDTLYAIHFEAAERYSEYGGYTYYLKRTKVLYPHLLLSCNVAQFLSRKANRFLSFDFKTAWLTNNKWWNPNQSIYKTI